MYAEVDAWMFSSSSSTPAVPLAAICLPATLHLADGTISAVNARAEVIAARPLAGLSIPGLIEALSIRHPRGRPLLPEELPAARALRGEEAPSLLLEITGGDGARYRLLASAVPLVDESGGAGALATWQDIRSLPDDGLELDRFFDMMTDGAAICELQVDEAGRPIDCRFLRTNPTFRTLLCSSPADTTGHTARDLIPGLEDRWIAMLGRVAAEEPGRLEDGIEHMGRHLNITAFRVADQRIAVLLRDETERRRAERRLAENEVRLELALDSASIGVYEWDLVTGEHRWDDRIRTHLGLRPGASLSFERFIAAIHSDDRGALQAGIAEGLVPPVDGAAFRDYRSKYRVIGIDDGIERWIATTGRTTYRNGHAVRVVGTMIDISRARHSEAMLQEYAANLERSNEDLERFAYIASHDLQEPLRSMVSFSQLLDRRYRGKLDEDADEYLHFIIEGGQRMQALIQDLLRISRVDTAGEPLAPTDAGAAVAGALHSLETPLADASATLTIGEMPTVMADPAQLEQVFANLFGNALKYRRSEVPLVVQVSASRRGDWWEFAVADNGIGIAPEYFDRIFVIFQRLHSKDEYEGTGIGLAVVRKIVERHGGRVWVESTPGEGSTFFFTLQAA